MGSANSPSVRLTADLDKPHVFAQLLLRELKFLAQSLHTSGGFHGIGVPDVAGFQPAP